MKIIPYGRQYIDINDIKLVSKALKEDLITTGHYVKKFENKVSQFLKVKYTATCNSGTSALHLAFLAINLKKNDVIIMPAVNFIAAFNMAHLINARIFLADVDPLSGQMTPETLLYCIKKNKLKKIKLIVTMYLGGYPKNVKKFYDIKKKYNFRIIEDACHALGAEYKFKDKFFKIGSCKHSDISVFSLHPLKTITSGEGGIITTNDSDLANRIKLFRSHGIVRNKEYWKYDVTEHGFNYRLSDINCALGISQLKKINYFLKKRKKIYFKYLNELKNFNKKIVIPNVCKIVRPSYHLFLINISFNKINKNKSHFIKYLNSKNILAQQHYIPIYKFSIYKKLNNFPGSENYFNNSVSIPIFSELNNKDQNKIIKVIKSYFLRLKK